MNKDEINLWKLYRLGDETAREELILLYMPLVKFWASRISRLANWADMQDLMQEGTIGLIKAVGRFDIERGHEFTTYARYYIREAIYKSPELTHNTARRQSKRYRMIKEKYDNMAEKLGRHPTNEELAQKLKLTVKQVQKALSAMYIAFPSEFSDSEKVLKLNTGNAERQHEIKLLEGALSKLDERETSIIDLYYWEGLSRKEISKRLELSVSNVSQIRQRVLKKLHGFIKGE